MGREIDFANPKEYKEFLSMQNSEEFQKLRKFYQNKTMMDILGVARQENPHSSFIAWLLDPKENHAMGTYALERFLETICFAYKKYGVNYLSADTNATYLNNYSEKAGKLRHFTDDEKKDICERLLFFECKNNASKENIISSLLYQDYSIKSVKIERERKINGTKARRADIWIELETVIADKDTKNILILVENKVHSSENDYQTLAYMQAVMNDTSHGAYQFDYFIPIYLYPATKDDINDAADSMSKSFPCINRMFLLLNYQYIMDGVLYPCRTYAEKREVINKLDDYIACLSQSIFGQGDEKTKDRSSIMAISPREKVLAKKLWDDYRDVLLDIGLNLENNKFKYIQDNKAFYQTILRPVCDSLGDDATGDECDLIEALSAQVDEEKTYFMCTKDGVKLKFASGAGAGKNISAFAYVIMYQFWRLVEDDSNITIKLVRDELSKKVKNKWLSGFLVTEAEEKLLHESWKKLSKSGECVCTRYNQKAMANEDDTLFGCPLDDSASNPLGKKQFKPGDEDKPFYKNTDCPIHAISNGELRESFYNGTGSVGRRGLNCSCYYDFLHCFCVKDLSLEHPDADIFAVETENMVKNDCNQVFPKIPVGKNGEFVYMSRYWFRDDIKQMVEVLNQFLPNDKLEDYWVCKLDAEPKKLKFDFDEFSLIEASEAAKK